MLLPEIMDSEVRAFQSIIVALSDIEINILRYLVEINCKNIYSQSNLNVLRKIDTSVTKNRIQVTVEKLCQLNVLYKVKRGVWEFNEPVNLFPKTGRKHQLRRHMGHISHPIIGDTNHGDGKQNQFARDHLHFSKLALCATKLSFTHPSTQQPMICETTLEDDFQALVALFL